MSCRVRHGGSTSKQNKQLFYILICELSPRGSEVHKSDVTLMVFVWTTSQNTRTTWCSTLQTMCHQYENKLKCQYNIILSQHRAKNYHKIVYSICHQINKNRHIVRTETAAWNITQLFYISLISSTVREQARRSYRYSSCHVRYTFMLKEGGCLLIKLPNFNASTQRVTNGLKEISILRESFIVKVK